MRNSTLTFVGHLEELRRAIIRSFLAVVICTAICLPFSEQLYFWLRAPLQEALPKNSISGFVFKGPFQIYISYFKISMTFGLFLSLPFIFYFIWSFIRPGLKREEAKGIIPLALICSFLFIGGALFGYFIVFPAGFNIASKLVERSNSLLLPEAADYISIAISLLLAFGIMFELPLVVFLLGKLGIVSLATFRKSRKYLVVLTFLIAAIITPGDAIVMQVLISAPLLILFELSLIAIKLFKK